MAVLWAPSSSKLAYVGLIEGGSGTGNVTRWAKSDAKADAEGEEVVLRNVALNWYRGRVAVSLTGRSEIQFPIEGSGG